MVCFHTLFLILTHVQTPAQRTNFLFQYKDGLARHHENVQCSWHGS